MTTPAPVHAATAQHGHIFVNDPVAPLSAMRRWTCTACDRAVLVRPDGTAYGSATTDRCASAYIGHIGTE